MTVAIVLVTVATIALTKTIAHLSYIVLGEPCYGAHMAPGVIVNTAIKATWETTIFAVVSDLIWLLACVCMVGQVLANAWRLIGTLYLKEKSCESL